MPSLPTLRPLLPLFTLLALLAAPACGGPMSSDGGTDAPAPPRDVPASDSPAPPFDVPASDVPTADAPAADTPASDSPASDSSTPTDPLAPSLAPPVDTDPSHYPANVWVTGPLAKLQPSAMPASTDARWALISAARNETEGFQVHVRAATAPINLAVTVTDLLDARSGTRIPAASNVVVYREHYLNITTRSDVYGLSGEVPDGLVPAVDPYAHEPRNAFPFMVATGRTQSVWIDVLVPRDAPSGYYTGTVNVTDNGRMLAALPVRLKVWDFALPSTSTLRSAFGMSWNGWCVQAFHSNYDGCSMWPGASSADDGIERAHVLNATMFLDHRVTIGDVVYAGPSGSDWTHFDSVYAPLMNGTARLSRLSGAQLTGMRYSQGVNATQVQNWVNHFRTTGWLPRLYHYGCDEPPNGCSWAQTLTENMQVRAASPDLLTLLTTDWAGASAHGLTDVVDILSPVLDQVFTSAGDQRGSYDAWLTRPHKHLFWYQSCDEHGCNEVGDSSHSWPSYMIDATPVRNRVFQWMAYLSRIEGELYYATDVCWTDGSRCPGMDPWRSQLAFGGNGDGTLFYPGTRDRIGGTTPVPLPSVRLLHIRDGMEDFEYLHLLDAMGDAGFAQSTARGFITDPQHFSNDPARLGGAREALGDRIHHRAHP